MEHYAGETVTDRPYSNMAWITAGNPAEERHNFVPVDGKYRGYVVGGTHDIKRIVTGATAHVDGVLVVFVAPKPPSIGKGQVVVGWYRNARFFSKPKRKHGRCYSCECELDHAVCLQVSERKWPVPSTGPQCMASATKRFYEPGIGWMERIRQQIARYRRSTLAGGVDDQAAFEAQATVEAGQGYETNGNLRRKIELYAERHAIKYYTKSRHWSLQSHPGKPYDLEFTKGKQRIWVEVKGTRGSPDSVFLTANELDFYSAKHPHSELYILHSIGMRAGGPCGGKRLRKPKFKPQKQDCVPLVYRYWLRR
jgi:hypothetical protein